MIYCGKGTYSGVVHVITPCDERVLLVERESVVVVLDNGVHIASCGHEVDAKHNHTPLVLTVHVAATAEIEEDFRHLVPEVTCKHNLVGANKT